MFKAIFSVLLFASCLSTNVLAEEITKKEKNELTQKLLTTIGLNVTAVNHSPLPNLVELVTDQGLFYASKDGEYLLQGKLYGIDPDGVINHTDISLSKVRIEGLKTFKDGMITYPAKNEKYQITVFTDITCGYCRKMHQKMEEYNDLGITINYLAYPRAGVKDQFGQFSQGFKDLRSIWCHEDPSLAMTKAKSGSSVAQRICESPVEAEFNFGRQIGVNSTPAVIFPNGMLIPGYRDPEDLLKILTSIEAES